jgi:hypothetical protein
VSKARELLHEMGKKLDGYIEVKDAKGNLIGKYDAEQFRKLIGGARTGFAQDWVKQYNDHQKKENGANALIAELVFDIIKRGKRTRF